jgi:hypothetical protein
LVERQLAGNTKKKAETIRATGMVAVAQSTRKKQRVLCLCKKCGSQITSSLSIPSSKITELSHDRRVEFWPVDDDGNKIGVARFAPNATAVMPMINAEHRTVKKALESSDDGGGIVKPRGKRTQSFRLRYERRPDFMIVAPTCRGKSCKHTFPIKTNLRVGVHFVHYSTLYRRVHGSGVKELRELCQSMEIVFTNDMGKKELQALINEHANGANGEEDDMDEE